MPLVPNDYSCKDTFYFVYQINNANLSKNFVVSYNATSLFTNIPLQATIDIAKNLIFIHNPNLTITRKKTLKTFPFCYITDSFYFNRKFYNQIHGAATGCALASVLTNIFMGFYKSKGLHEYSLNIIQEGGSGDQKGPPTSSFSVTSANLEVCPRNFLTFSFNPFATPE